MWRCGGLRVDARSVARHVARWGNDEPLFCSHLEDDAEVVLDWTALLVLLSIETSTEKLLILGNNR